MDFCGDTPMHGSNSWLLGGGVLTSEGSRVFGPLDFFALAYPWQHAKACEFSGGAMVD